MTDSVTQGPVRGILGGRIVWKGTFFCVALATMFGLVFYGWKQISPPHGSTKPQQATSTLSYSTQPTLQDEPVARERVVLEHTTEYEYDRPVILAPTIVRLLPQPWTIAGITEGELSVMTDGTSLVRREHDAEDNVVAAIRFSGETKSLTVRNRLTVEIPNSNSRPDFRPLQRASAFPIQYLPEESKRLASYLEPATNLGPRFRQFTDGLPPARASSVDWLADVNKRVLNQAKHFTRLEEGVLSPEDTLDRGGSCRDFAWLLVQVLRKKGIPTRFVSGYQVPDEVLALRDRQVRTAELHAWVEGYLPGAGWVGLDPTTGEWTTAAYIPVAAAARPADAGPLDGTFAVVNPLAGVLAKSDLRFKITVQNLGTVKP
jgi:transglutaminase-like putative cysteine protease